MSKLSAIQSNKIAALLPPITSERSPGYAVALVTPDDQYIFTAGCARVEDGLQITPSTQFHVASISKQFTAYAVAQLADQEIIDLDEDIRQYLPFVPDFVTPITVRNLLQHTSGLCDQWELLALSGRSFADHLTQKQILRLVERQTRLAFAPGDAFRYCNTGYTLAAELVSAATGQSFNDYCQGAIFGPAGMSSSQFPEQTAAFNPNMALSYMPEDGGFRQLLLNFSNYGATALVTSLDDMISWARFLLFTPQKSALSLDRLGAPGKLNDGRPFRYGLGLTTYPLASQKTYAHTGIDAGYRACTAYFPEKQGAIVLLANFPLSPMHLVEHLAAIWFTSSPLQYPATERVRALAGDFGGLVGQYFSKSRRLLSISAQDGGLVARQPGHSSWPVYASEDTVDFGLDGLGRFAIARDKTGTIAALRTDPTPEGSAETIQYDRVEKWCPSQLELDALTGTYRCAELDVTYDLVLRDGTLSVDTVLGPYDVKLHPSIPDRFDGDGGGVGSIVFERDSAGVPIGFRCVSDRHDNIMFIRTEMA